MKRVVCMCATLILLFGTTGMASAAYQWSLPHNASFDTMGNGYYTDDGTATGNPLYGINWAAHVVDGTGTIPNDGVSWPYYSSWQDGSDLRDQGTFSLGRPDLFYYDDPGHEMDGGGSGFSGGSGDVDSWVTLGFDQALVNRAGIFDMRVYQFGWGVTGMEIFVSSDATYTNDAGMTWVSMGMLDTTAKPFAWGYGAGSPYMNFEFGDYGVDNITFVKFKGAGHWIDAVGAPVPIPGAVWLLGSGLMALVGLRKKRGR